MNTGYHNHVAGIGNDMALEGLNQPKSHSIHTPFDAITMANSNFTTPTSMVAGDYLLWGHNTGNLNYTCQNFNHASPTTAISALYNRVWRTQKTGTPAGNVIIEVDMSLLQGPTGLGSAINSDIRLLIDNNTVFNDGLVGDYTISPNPGYSATGGMIYFTVPYANIQSGQGFFGIGMASPVPIANAGNDISVCSGISGLIGTTSTAGFSYSWSPSTGLSSASASNPTVTLTNGTASPVVSTYTITTTTIANGCTASDQVQVTVNPIPTVNAGPDQTVCDGTSVTLTGAGALTYSWTPPVSDGIAFTPASTATYTVTGTTVEGCTNTDQVTITVTPFPIINAGSDQTVCDGTAVTLIGSGGSSYSWTGGITDGVSFIPLTTATYTVTGTAGNCTGTDQILVTVNPNPAPIINGPATYCNGDYSTLATSIPYS